MWNYLSEMGVRVLEAAHTATAHRILSGALAEHDQTALDEYRENGG